jgi:ATP-binding cassette subfamily C (CFTR/MRP) protein 1
LDTGSAYTSLSLIYLLTDPMVTVLRTIPMLSAALACFNRIQIFLLSDSREDRRLPLNRTTLTADVSHDSSSALEERNTAIELHDIRGDSHTPPGVPMVVISNASFGWADGQAPVLQDISVSIRKTKTTFIIGNVGCGKSTLMKAMLGEIQPSKGSVYSGIRNVAYVGQDPWVQNLTIRENILGVTTYDRDWYSRVVYACGLEQDILAMSNGDATKAGSSGVSLSGGQKQRLALARAVYSREKVVFLDDVFSGQDAGTESHVHQNLFGERGLFREIGATVVCIASTGKLAANFQFFRVAVLTRSNSPQPSQRRPHYRSG